MGVMVAVRLSLYWSSQARRRTRTSYRQRPGCLIVENIIDGTGFYPLYLLDTILRQFCSNVSPLM